MPPRRLALALVLAAAPAMVLPSLAHGKDDKKKSDGPSDKKSEKKSDPKSDKKKSSSGDSKPKSPPSLTLESIDIIAGRVTVRVGGASKPPDARVFSFH